jgi:hypothetical protein
MVEAYPKLEEAVTSLKASKSTRAGCSLVRISRPLIRVSAYLLLMILSMEEEEDEKLALRDLANLCGQRADDQSIGFFLVCS